MTGTFKVCEGIYFIFHDDSGNSVSGKRGKFEVWKKGGEKIGGWFDNLEDALIVLEQLS